MAIELNDEQFTELLNLDNEQFAKLIDGTNLSDLEVWLQNELSKADGRMSLAEIDALIDDMECPA